MFDPTLQDAWLRLKHLSAALRDECPAHKLSSLHKGQALVSTKTDAQDLYKAMRRQSGEIRRAADVFLLEHGCTRFGEVKKPSPHTPKAKIERTAEQVRAEIEALTKQLQELK